MAARAGRARLGARLTRHPLHGGRAPLNKPELDVHLIDVMAACGVSAAKARTVSLSSRFEPWTELRLEREPAGHHVHDRTRPTDEH